MSILVSVSFNEDQRFEVRIPKNTTQTPVEARAWLDAQFVEMECEPIRMSGKVLTADKALAVAQDAGAARFAADADWAHAFATAISTALGRDNINVDVSTLSVGF